MNKRSLFYSICLVFVSSFFQVDSSNYERESAILYTVMGISDYLHFSPKEIDDTFSEAIFDDYISLLDESKRFLLQSEINHLSTYIRDIDNQINDFDFEFFNKTCQVIDDAIDRAEGIYKEIIHKDISINEMVSYETDGAKKEHPSSIEALYQEWEDLIQYTVVGKMYDLSDSDKSKEELKNEAILKTMKLYDEWFERLHNISRNDRFDQYINIIMSQFDPHSSYFSPQEQENFEIQMGNKLEGIGAQLLQEGDFVKVMSIVPGGPAWKGQELQENDIIIEVQQENEKSIDIAGMRVEDVIRMIRGDKGSVVILKVKRTGGITKTIAIERDEIILEDALARSAIIGIENEVNRIGYIHLPLFYGTFDGGKSCAADVEKEIAKLNKDGVNGIILDLRYNRGGSLPDAIDMTGLFIEKGPVLQVTDNRGEKEIYKDENKNVAYDGPLIVLVNGVSASSSEIVAGALQDYDRAVIVGGPKTYGKGTVQGLFDLDRMIEGDHSIKPLGQVKLTVQKFFRVSGESNQLKGIIPDIIVPDEFYSIEYGESDNEDALSYSKIKPLSYNQNVYKTKKIDILKSNSQVRVEDNPNFTRLKEYSQFISGQEDKTQVYLDFDMYKNELDDMSKKMDRFDSIFEDKIEDMYAQITSSDESYVNEFTTRKIKSDRFLNSLLSDIQLNESLLIMQDMLDFDKRLVQK